MDYLHLLEAIQPAQRALVGEHAFRLSQLQRQGYPTLPGIVVDSTSCARAIAAACESEPALADLWQQVAGEPEDISANSLQHQARAAARAIQTIPTTEAMAIATALQEMLATWPVVAVALRPSFAFPGAERRSIPDLLGDRAVRGDRPEELAIALQQLWIQAFSGQSLFYWRKLGVPLSALGVSVLVQPLFPTKIAGQVRATPECWEIETISGLGHSLIRGEADPERCLLVPDSGRIISQQPGQQLRIYQPTAAIANAIESIPLDTKLPFPLLDLPCLEQLTAVLQQLALDTPEFELDWEFSLAEERLHLGRWSPLLPPANAPAARRPGRGSLRGIAAAPGRAIASAYLLEAGERASVLSPGWIVVARQIAPAQLPLLEQASGIILEEGGLTSHGAILARELGIPAVVGVPAATAILHPGQTIALDGDRGEVDPDPDPTPEPAIVSELPPTAGPANPPANPNPIAAAVEAAPLPVEDERLWGTQLLVNLSQAKSAPEAARLPVDGVGLLRADLLLLAATKQHPLATWLQRDRRPQLLALLIGELERIVVPFAPRPVFYRACDWLDAEGTETEGTPWLGRRGTARIRQDPTLFDLELAAIAQLRQQGHAQLKLVLPFVRSVEEFQFCRQRAIAAGLADLEIWLMLEVPSALLLLPDYAAAGAAGFAIGTNDLTQLVLGVERDAPDQPYDERHPAMLAALQQAIAQARDLGLPCSLCGQMVARFPETIDACIRWGITALSVEPTAVTATAQAIARAERRLLLDAARQLAAKTRQEPHKTQQPSGSDSEDLSPSPSPPGC